mmetsp:Transcript_24972/g.58083  ORF Transcript_24972/g.58083 Transcript_24972/m.58083 type:complete len:282 (-) Transcript_24972:221-1066(-)
MQLLADVPVCDFMGQWSSEQRVYGIVCLLRCRALMTELPKPAEVAHLKYLATCRGATKKTRCHKPPRQSPTAAATASQEGQEGAVGAVGDVTAPEVSNGGSELTEVCESAGHTGTWWRACGNVDIIVRKNVSLFSEELRRIKPGCCVQQNGLALRFVSGQTRGLVRLPVQPDGWVTSDAQAAGGPKFLEPTGPPRWRVVYESGTPHGDVLVRSGSNLESEEVAVLRCGDVIEQAGPQQMHGGVWRMLVSVPDAASSWYRAGWVSVDARPAGGPVFLEALPP